MNHNTCTKPRQLMDHVRALEGMGTRDRGQYVMAYLDKIGKAAVIQRCRLLNIANIIVDFSGGYSGKHPLISAHYDVVKRSPGANDNASGVAVLLGLCRELKYDPKPVRVVFFDHEEAWFRTPVLRLGLLGSLYYVWKAGIRDISAVYNVEFCGEGDFLGIWSVHNVERTLPSYTRVVASAGRLSLAVKPVHIPWVLMSSDHLSFRLGGLPDAMTLSLLPGSQVPLLEKWFDGKRWWQVIGKRRQLFPEPVGSVHTARDTSDCLNEKSLELMLSLLHDLINKYTTT